jgi:hypothetical protein
MHGCALRIGNDFADMLPVVQIHFYSPVFINF